MSTTVTPKTPQGDVIALGVPDSQDYPRLVYCAPYFQVYPLAELLEPSVQESVESMLPGLVPPYVQDAANTAVQNLAVLLAGSTMSGPLFLNGLPTQPTQAADKQYVDLMISTAGIPEVPTVPSGQTWGRQTGQWVPIASAEGTFLPLSGGQMLGTINMGGNPINNLPSVPNLPNGAAPAEWVLSQIAASSLYQGTWNVDTYQPDLTQPQYHQNNFSWIAITTSSTGVVVSPPIPGLQGLTIYNGDTIIYSAMQGGQFQAIHAGGLSLSEADARYLQLAGGQMAGHLLLYQDPVANMEAATRQWVLAQIGSGGVPEAPTDGQIYGRNGNARDWMPVVGLGGATLSGPLILAANAVANLQAVPLQQLQSTVGNYVPLTGNATVTGPITMAGAGSNLTLNSNASANLQAVPLQQLTSTLSSYVTQTQLTAAVAPYVPQNYVDNSGFIINQRAYASGTALAAGVYGLDRWKAGTSGCTLTFTETPASTVVTITAGSLQQVIEGAEMVSGTYTLSWTGTATGRIATTSGGGTYAASPVQLSGTSTTNTFIEFTGGTVSRVQLQLGTVATPWQPLALQAEMLRCQRYYTAVMANLRVLATGLANYACSVNWPTLRTTPTVLTPSGASNQNTSSVTLTPTGAAGGSFSLVPAATGDTYSLGGLFPLSADM